MSREVVASSISLGNVNAVKGVVTHLRVSNRTSSTHCDADAAIVGDDRVRNISRGRNPDGNSRTKVVRNQVVVYFAVSIVKQHHGVRVGVYDAIIRNLHHAR